MPRRRKIPKELEEASQASSSSQAPPPVAVAAPPAAPKVPQEPVPHVREEGVGPGRGAVASPQGAVPLGFQPGQGRGRGRGRHGGGRVRGSRDGGRGTYQGGGQGIQYPVQIRGGQSAMPPEIQYPGLIRGGQSAVPPEIHYPGLIRGGQSAMPPEMQYPGLIRGGQSAMPPFQAQVPPGFPPLGPGEKRMGGVVGSSYTAPSAPQPHLSFGTQHPSASLPKSSLEPQFGKINVQEPPPVEEQDPSSPVRQPPPVSSRALRFPLRPGKGQFGTNRYVKANHFFAELPDKDLHQYDVAITPEVTSRGVNRAVMELLVKLYREDLGPRIPAYDGRKSLYTAGPLPFESKEYQVNLLDEDDGSSTPRRERSFKVVIKFAARVDLHHLGQFLLGRPADAPPQGVFNIC